MFTNDSDSSARQAPTDLEQPGPDPESLKDVAQGNVLVKIAVGLLILLALFGLIIALT